MLPALEHDLTDWLALCALAFALDLLAGSPKLLGRLPGPDQLFVAANKFIASKLDRPARSAQTRFLRGALLLLVFLPATGTLGFFLDRYVFDAPAAMGLAVALLTLLIGQRAIWQAAMSAGGSLAGKPQTSATHGQARQIARALVLRFSDGLVSNVLVVAIGGFAVLLPFRFIVSVVTSADEPGLIARPKSPFFKAAGFLYEIAGFPGAFLASLFLSAAQILVPGTNMDAITGLRPKHLQGLACRSMPLSVVAQGLGLVFEGAGTDKQGKKRWLGPPDGKARMGPAEVRRSLLLVIVGCAIVVLAACMTSAYLLSRVAAHV